MRRSRKRKLVGKSIEMAKAAEGAKSLPRRALARTTAKAARQVTGLPLPGEPGQITVEQLRKIFPMNKVGQPTDAHLQAVADELNRDPVNFKLDTPVRRAHFFGQIKQESPLLDGAAESLNYTPAGLRATFGYYQKHPDEAQADGRLEERDAEGRRRVLRKANQEAIANKAYMGPDGNTGLGNLQPGDGWRFRGRGVHQTTGRDNYRAFTKAHPRYWAEKVDFVANPELLETMPYNLRSAVVFWLERKCWEKADAGVDAEAIDALTALINAGEIRKHLAGQYAADQSPVLKRRAYVQLAFTAFA